MIAAEVRALASSDSIRNLFDLLSQFLSQIHAYRWLALAGTSSPFFYIHHFAAMGEAAVAEARAALGTAGVEPSLLEDEDALGEHAGPPAVVGRVLFAGREIAKLAMGPAQGGAESTRSLLEVLASELGGALRMTILVEEARFLASIDPLTRIMNRRAFLQWGERELARLDRYGGDLCIGLIDVDHFKAVNDQHGHQQSTSTKEQRWGHRRAPPDLGAVEGERAGGARWLPGARHLTFAPSRGSTLNAGASRARPPARGCARWQTRAR